MARKCRYQTCEFISCAEDVSHNDEEVVVVGMSVAKHWQHHPSGLRCNHQLATSLSGCRSRHVWPISCCSANAALTRKHTCQGHMINLKTPPSSLASQVQPRTATSPSVMAFKDSKDFTVTNSFFHEIQGSATTHHHHKLGEFLTCLLPAMLTQLNVTIRRTSYNYQQCKLIDKQFLFFFVMWKWPHWWNSGLSVVRLPLSHTRDVLAITGTPYMAIW